MDKSRDGRRGGTGRFSPAKRQIIKQSGMDDNGGDVFLEKSKKEKLRRLSVFGRVSSSNESGQMGSVGSDGEDELRPTTNISKRFKVPRKFFDDCNTVDHASVPRKLRSAMKKRNNESISPPLPDKKPNHGINEVEFPRKDRIKKSKPNLQQQRDLEGSPSGTIVGPITKDEEEVVETLYALAVMFPFPNNNTHAKSSPLLEGESSRPAFEDSESPEKEEDSKSLCPSTTAEAANPSLLEGSAQETVPVKCSNVPSHPAFPTSAQLHTELDNTISQTNIQAIPLLSKSEPIDGKPVGSHVQSELYQGTGSKQPKHEEAAAYVEKPEIAAGSAAAVSSQNEQQHILKESKNSGSALWPGLSSTASDGIGTRGPSLQSSAAKSLVWLGTDASATRPGSLDNGALSEKKDFRAPVTRKKSWKRCSAHVYISRLVKVLQIFEIKERSPVQPTQLTPNEGSKQGVLLAANSLNRVQSGLNGAVSAHNTVSSAAEKNSNEVRNAIGWHKRFLQDQQQASTTSALYTTQKQSFDFLSLSAGSGGVEATNSTIKVGNGLEPLTQFHIPYLQSLAQNPTVLPFSRPQNRFSYSPFTDNLPAAAANQVQIQPPPYLGSPVLGPPHLGTSANPKQLQQQQRIWTAPLAAQYKTVGVAASNTPNWQNGRQDPSVIQYAQFILPPSHSSLELLGPKYAPISQQQQQQQQQHIDVASSLPTARAKRQPRHLSSGYEANGVGSCPDAAVPLQLLCNEHL